MDVDQLLPKGWSDELGFVQPEKLSNSEYLAREEVVGLTICGLDVEVNYRRYATESGCI